MSNQQEPGHGQQVVFPDKNLEAEVRESLWIAKRLLTCNDLKRLESLSAWGYKIESLKKVENLAGLERCVNLTRLNVSRTKVSDVTPLAGLTNLTRLDLGHTQINDVTPLASLSSLTRLDIEAWAPGGRFPKRRTVSAAKFDPLFKVRPESSQLLRCDRIRHGDESVTPELRCFIRAQHGQFSVCRGCNVPSVQLSLP